MIPRLALLVTATALSYAVGWLIGIPALVPALNTLPAFPFLYGSLSRGRTNRAIGEMLAWAAVLAVSSTLIAYLDPARAGRLFLNGDAYRREMFFWVMTGVGAESQPAQFVPTHLTHASVFSALSLLTGSVLSMPIGALLMNYMGTYVGSLAAVSHHPVLTVLAGWVPWSLIRIASFVILGVVFAGPVASRLLRFRFELRRHFALLMIGLAGLLADIVLKAALAPPWHVLLRRIVGW